MFEWNTELSEEERIMQNISNMTELRRGDLAYDRELGVLGDWIDKPEGTLSAEIMSDITEMLNENEPRVTSSVEMSEAGKMQVVIEEQEVEEEDE